MNCFQLIKTVLDEAYDAVPGSPQEKDAAIIAALKHLSEQYEKLLVCGCLDYSDPATRFAYIFRYTTCHANLVYSVLDESVAANTVFNGDQLSIACVGGGPGSDFLGILKYCLSNNKSPQLRCQILDRDKAWSESWTDVDAKLGTTFRLSTSFQPFDVTDGDTWRVFRKHFKSDVITMVYFMSEVYARRKEAEVYFDTLLGNAKAGAVVLFIDNQAAEFYQWFDALAAKHSIAIETSHEGLHQLPSAEEKRDLAPYFGKFDNPKIQARIAHRIGVKQ